MEHYAIMPHKGDWAEGKIWTASEKFNLALHATLLGLTKHGSQSLEKSFLELESYKLHISAVKKSENG